MTHSFPLAGHAGVGSRGALHSLVGPAHRTCHFVAWAVRICASSLSQFGPRSALVRPRVGRTRGGMHGWTPVTLGDAVHRWSAGSEPRGALTPPPSTPSDACASSLSPPRGGSVVASRESQWSREARGQAAGERVRRRERSDEESRTEHDPRAPAATEGPAAGLKTQRRPLVLHGLTSEAVIAVDKGVCGHEGGSY